MNKRERFDQLVDGTDHLVGMADPAGAAPGGLERAVGAQSRGQEHEDGEYEGYLDFIAREETRERSSAATESWGTRLFVYNVFFTGDVPRHKNFGSNLI